MNLSISIDLILVFLLFILFIYVFVSVEINSMHKAYFMFHFAMMLWPFCQFMIKITENSQLQLFYVKVAFADLSLLAVGWLVFTMFLTGKSKLIQRKISLVLFVPALLAAIAAIANPYGLFVIIVQSGFAQGTYGPLFWYILAILLGYLLVSLYLLYRTLVSDTAPRIKKQVKLLLKGILILSVLALSDVFFNVILAQWLPIIQGLTSLGILLSDICFVIAIYRDKVFDVVRIAHQDVFDTMGLGILVLDEDETVMEINPALSPYVSLRVGDRFNMKESLSQGNIISNSDEFLHSYQQYPSNRAEIELTVLENNLQYVTVQVMPIIVKGLRVGRIITFQDVSEIRRLVDETYLQNESLHKQNQALIVVQNELSQVNQKLEQMAITDSLTGCYNRHYLTQYLEHEVMMNVRFQKPFAIYLIDIDFFKLVNDQHGHIVGDEVICGTVDAIKKTLRQTDILARYGGEEFMIYVPHTDRSQAIILAERLKTVVEENKVLTDNKATSLSVTISIGLLPMDDFKNENTENPKAYLNDLFVSVDEALYQAKKEGRNRIITRTR